MNRAIFGVAVMIATGSVAEPHQNAQAGLAPAIKTVLDCRSIDDRNARLACFDQTTVALNTSLDKHEVVVMDRQQVKEARRSLFGFELPSLAIFNSGNREAHDASAEEADREMAATLKFARQDKEGNWVFGLDNGAVWHQNDGSVIPRIPKSGMPITIRRGAFGSYLLKVGNQPAVKAQRES